jgi:hypothetical protein
LQVLVAILIYRQGAYILDKLLANQSEIQRQSPQAELAIATAEPDFAPEMSLALKKWEIKGKVIQYNPDQSVGPLAALWNITCGRQALREYFLNQTDAEALFFMDADMTYDPGVIEIMCRELPGFGAVFSGSYRKDFGIGLAGAGCLLISRAALEKIDIRCYQFANGEIIHEDTVLEMDLFRSGYRINKGFFVSLDHYLSPTEVKHTDRQKVGLLKGLVNNALLRYCLIRTSVALHYNIPSHLMHMKRTFFDNFK